MKRTVELRPVATDHDVYVVVKLINSTSPLVGSKIHVTEVDKLIRRPTWTVVIKKGGE